jgi:glycosyltransferase involved in cell wall biosynthesis
VPVRSLVFVTQEVDPAHPALAATIPKLHALARRLDRVTVLAAGAVPGTLPENCAVRTFGAATKAGRGVRFERALAAELLRRPDAVLAHMCPVYAVLAAPLARPARVPVLLWYTHWHASRTLRLAERAATTVLSVDRRSFPLDSPKVRAIGHGIDLDEFPCRHDTHAADGLRLLALGRYSPAKGLDVVLRALRRLLDGGHDVRLIVRGPTLSALERGHADALGRLAAELRLRDNVDFGGPVPRSEVPDLLAAADALVNNMRAGAPDKVVYEAAAACTPVVASNPVFDTLLPETMRFDREDPASLAARLEAFARTPVAERVELARILRRRVAEAHSVEHWADEVLAAAAR